MLSGVSGLSGTVGAVGIVSGLCRDCRGVLDSARAWGLSRNILFAVGAVGLLSGCCRGCRVSGLSGLSSGCRDHVGCECRSVGPGLRQTESGARGVGPHAPKLGAARWTEPRCASASWTIPSLPRFCLRKMSVHAARPPRASAPASACIPTSVMALSVR